MSFQAYSPLEKLLFPFKTIEARLLIQTYSQKIFSYFEIFYIYQIKNNKLAEDP